MATIFLSKDWIRHELLGMQSYEGEPKVSREHPIGVFHRPFFLFLFVSFPIALNARATWNLCDKLRFEWFGRVASLLRKFYTHFIVVHKWERWCRLKAFCFPNTYQGDGTKNWAPYELVVDSVPFMQIRMNRSLWRWFRGWFFLE